MPKPNQFLSNFSCGELSGQADNEDDLEHEPPED